MNLQNTPPDIEADPLIRGHRPLPPPKSGFSKFVSSLARTWVMLSIHYYRPIGLFLALLLTVLLSLTIYYGAISLLTACLLIVAVLTGMYVASHAFIIFIERAKMFLQQAEPHPMKIHSPAQGTGLESLDLLVNSVNSHISRLQDTIDVLQENDETIDYTVIKLTDNLAAAVVIRNPDGELSHCNLYTELLYGVQRKTIYETDGDFFESVVHAEDQEQYRRGMKIVYSGIENRFRYRFTHQAGIEMWAETSGVPVYNEEGQLLFYVFSTFDVTELERTRLQLQERTREVEDFSYMISHDLKSPLFTLKGMVSVLQDELKDTDSGDLKEAMEHIDTAMNRLQQLVESVVDYARITRTEFELTPLNIPAVVQEVLQEYKQELDNLDADVSLSFDCEELLGDNLSVYQVLSNLIGNTIKYRSHERTLALAISASLIEEKQQVCISLTDNGSGIPADTLDDIFRPFKRAHGQEVAGTGIGLASVHKLMNKMQGAVGVESTRGSGSSFHLYFKATDSE